MTLFNTLLLDTVAWDLVLDSNRNIALGAPPYAVAQDVASAVRLFLGELWYDTTQGLPYWQKVLGHTPPLSLVKQLIVNQALTVSGVVSAQCIISSFNLVSRQISGQVQFIDENGVKNNVSF